jgi:two-component system sensor histidine kinase KdpD
VRTPEEHASRIDTDVQRRLVRNIQLAQGMGADVVTVDGEDVAETLITFALEHAVGLVILGQSRRSLWRRLRRKSVVERLVRNPHGLDVMVVPFGATEAPQ